MHNLDILIPVKNEAKNIPAVVGQVHAALKEANISHKIILIVDKSTDETLAVALKQQEKYPVIVHEKIGEPGKAFSILEGIDMAQAPIIGFIDGDLQYPPRAIPKMYEKMQIPNTGVIVANRKHYKSQSLLRKIGSRVNAFLFGRLLLGLNCDIQSGLKLFKRDIGQHIDRNLVTAWTIDIPLLHAARELGYSINQIDINFENRANGASHIGIAKTAWAIMKCAITVKLQERKPYTLKENDTLIGAGVIYKNKKFITHNGLDHNRSALYTLRRNQKIAISSIIVLLVACIYFQPYWTALTLVGVLSFIYFFDMIFNFYLINKSLRNPPELSFSETELANLDDKALPFYTILCPLYKEWEVITQFVENIQQLDWPKDKLEVLLLLEENDAKTIEVANSLELPSFVKIIIVPNSMPKTKPKACNYGLHFAKGEYVVVYDAEDQPEPFQIKKAYLAFQQSDDKTLCVQAKLNYYNPDHNLLTKLFTAEYSLWFDIILPSLQSINTTIPLGGTSNHFRTQKLASLHGWDPFNVTEDCDLGVRLFKDGFKTAIIDSVTLEEANSNVGNWIRQRSRWLKGYMQTYFVHMRDPKEFFLKHGWHAVIFQLIIGLRISFILINPILWAATLSYFALYSIVGPTIESLYPTSIFYMAATSLIFGNFMYLYNYMIGLAKRGQWSLLKYVYFIPFYWAIMSIAAVMAFWQLIFKPHHWEKTIHGFHLAKIKKKYEVLLTDAPKPSAKSFVQQPEPANINLESDDSDPQIESENTGTAETDSDASTDNSQHNDKSVFNKIWNFIDFIKEKAGVKIAGADILIFAALLENVFNFLYNAYLGRVLSVEDFGLISLFGSFLFIVKIPSSALSRTVTHKTAYFLGKYDTILKEFWRYIRHRTIIISLVITGLYLVCIPFLQRYFHENSMLPFLLFAPVWFIALVSAVDLAFLSGGMRFKVLAALAISYSLAKFLFSYVFVTVGQDELVYAATPLAMTISFLIGWYFATRTQQKHVKVDGAEIHTFPLKFFISSAIIKMAEIAFFTMDIILAKHFLSPIEAGQYSLISLVGKMIFFIGGLFSQFILPIVSKEEGARGKSTKVFYKLFFSSTLASFMVYLFVGVFGVYTTPLLFGAKVLPIVYLLPIYGLSMLFFQTADTIISFYQAKSRHLVAFLTLILAVLQIIGLSMFHANLTQYVWVMTAVGGANLAVMLAFHFAEENYYSIRDNFKDLLSIFDTVTPKNVNSGSYRILIFNWRDTQHKWAGGAEVYVQELGKRMVAMGHDVTLFCGNDRKNPRHEVIDGVKIIRRGGFYTVYIWAFIYYIARFRGKIDVIIDSENGIPFFTPLYAKEPVIGLVHHIHREIILNQLKLSWYLKPAALVAKMLETYFMPTIYRNSQMITVSESTKKAMEEIGLGKKLPIKIVNPGVELQKFKTTKKTENPSLLYLGRLVAYKSVETVIHAVNNLIIDFPNLTFTIAGQGEHREKLENLVRNLNLEQHIKFTGKVDENTKIQLMGESWIYLYPSAWEGWGMTIVEANACGTPVVASNVPGLKDSVQNPETGYLVEYGNVTEFENKIRLLITDHKLRDELGRGGLEWSKNFAWEKSTKLLLAIIESKTA